MSLHHTKCAHDKGTQCGLVEILFLLRHRQQVGEDLPIIVTCCGLHVRQFGRVFLLALTIVVAMGHDDSAPNTVFEGKLWASKSKRLTNKTCLKIVGRAFLRINTNPRPNHTRNRRRIIAQQIASIRVDLLNSTIEVDINNNEYQKRKDSFVPIKKPVAGYLSKYIKLVSSAAGGAVCS